MLDSLLAAFKLNQKESALVTKLVELGSQPASYVARVCHIPRNTARSILDSLVERGILIKSRRGRTQYYAIETSEKLIRGLKAHKIRQAEQIDEQIEALKRHSSEWDRGHHSANRPKVTFYEGAAGLERVYEDTLTAKNGLKSWADYDALYDNPINSDYFPPYFARRAAAGIPMRSIHPDSPRAREGQATDFDALRQSALIPRDQFDWTPEIQVYDNKVNITSWKEQLGIIIENQEIADAMSVIFDLAWIAATQLGQVNGIDYEAELKKRAS